MPCPPSFEELQMMRNDQSLDRSIPLFDKWKEEIIDTYSLLQDWTTYTQKKAPETLTLAISIAEGYTSENPPKWDKPRPKNQSDQLSEANINYYTQMADWYENKVNELELSLCILRTWICQEMYSGVFIPPLFVSRFSNEENRHIVHRTSEKEEVIKKLQFQIEMISLNLEKKSEPNKIPELESELKKVQSQIEQLNSMETELLLTNRNILFDIVKG